MSYSTWAELQLGSGCSALSSWDGMVLRCHGDVLWGCPMGLCHGAVLEGCAIGLSYGAVPWGCVGGLCYGAMGLCCGAARSGAYCPLLSQGEVQAKHSINDPIISIPELEDKE